MYWFWPSIAEASTFMPPAASTFAKGVDDVYWFLLVTSVISCVLVIGGMIYFALKYRRRTENDKTAYISHNSILEFLWSFIPFVIFMVVFAWGWYIYHEMRNMPKDALEVHVVGQKWNWDFIYKSGKKTAGEFVVPVNTPVKLIMTSKDVLHSFFVPAFRMKQDVIPGRYTALWFEANQVGDFHVFCTEYCGDGHSDMLGKVHVLSREQYDDWLQKDPYKGLSLSQVGEKVFANRCTACHTLTAEKKVGPGFKGIFGREEVLESGAKITVDENYIRESVLNPNTKIVAGYPAGVMPTFQGQLDEQELAGLVEYMKSIK